MTTFAGSLTLANRTLERALWPIELEAVALNFLGPRQLVSPGGVCTYVTGKVIDSYPRAI